MLSLHIPKLLKLIKFNLQEFHLVQNIFRSIIYKYIRRIITIMMVIRRYAKLNKCLWACMNMNFCCTFPVMLEDCQLPEILSILYFLVHKEKPTNLVEKIIISECSQNLNKQDSAPLFIQNCTYLKQGLFYTNEKFLYLYDNNIKLMNC